MWGIEKLNQKIVIMDCSIKSVIFEWLISYISFLQKKKAILEEKIKFNQKKRTGIGPRENVNTCPQTI